MEASIDESMESELAKSPNNKPDANQSSPPGVSLNGNGSGSGSGDGGQETAAPNNGVAITLEKPIEVNGA